MRLARLSNTAGSAAKMVTARDTPTSSFRPSILKGTLLGSSWVMAFVDQPYTFPLTKGIDARERIR